MRLIVFVLMIVCLLTLRPALAAEVVGVVTEDPGTPGAVAVQEGFMVPYEATIPGTTVTFEMIPIPGGEFTLGSPETEANRRDDEGPQVREG